MKDIDMTKLYLTMINRVYVKKKLNIKIYKNNREKVEILIEISYNSILTITQKICTNNLLAKC